MLVKRNRIPIKKILLLGFLPSFIKIIYYRLMGARIGKKVKIGFGSIINCKQINVGDNVEIGHFTIISGRKLSIDRFTQINSLTFIDVPNIEIGEDVVIRENVLIGGNETPKSTFIIGDRSHIRQSCVINTSDSVKIGKESAIGGGTKIFTHSSWQSILNGYPCTYSPVVIGDNVWVGWDVFVMPGVTIEQGALITTGSVVTHNTPQKCIVSGNPAKVVIPSPLFPRGILNDEKKEIMLKLFMEFTEHLKHYNIGSVLTQNDSLISISINKNGKQSFAVLLINTNFQCVNSLSDNDVLIIFEPLDKTSYEEFVSNGMMILDLSNDTRWNSNDLGEELVEYFLKYGIKFARSKSQ